MAPTIAHWRRGGVLPILTVILAVDGSSSGTATLSGTGEAVSITPGAPELPRVTVDTTMPSTAGYVTKTVKASGGDFTSLQTAVNHTSVKNATTGIILTVDAGYVINEPVTLPAHTNPWVIIQSSAVASLPPGVRVSPSQASLMPTITVDSVGGVKPAVINNADGAHHYRFIGLNVTSNAGVFVYYLFKLQAVTLTSATLAPHHMIIDRCFVHADVSGTGGCYTGIQVDGTHIAVIDSYVSEIANNQNQETQCINSFNGWGPWKISNNYLMGSGENFMLGGTDPQVTNLVCEDLTFENNFCTKPLRWKKDDPSYSSFYSNNNPVVKNLFELKNARRALVRHNIFEYNWGSQGQDGIGILFNPRNQSGGGPQTIVADVTFTQNIIRHSGGGFNILGTDDAHPSQQTTRIDITHNLWWDIGDESGGPSPWGYQQWGQVTPPGASYVRILHNTIHQGGRILTLNPPASATDKAVGFVYRDNLSAHNLYGVFANGGFLGVNALNLTFAADYVFVNNALWGPNTNSVTYPPGNFQPATIAAVGFTNYPAANYLLTVSSPHHSGNAQDASDGTDLGVDTTALP